MECLLPEEREVFHGFMGSPRSSTAEEAPSAEVKEEPEYGTECGPAADEQLGAPQPGVSQCPEAVEGGLTLFVCELSLPPPQVPDKNWIGLRRLEAEEDDITLVRLLEEERTTPREEPAKAVGGARQRRGGCKDLRRY